MKAKRQTDQHSIIEINVFKKIDIQKKGDCDIRIEESKVPPRLFFPPQLHITIVQKYANKYIKS